MNIFILNEQNTRNPILLCRFNTDSLTDTKTSSNTNHKQWTSIKLSSPAQLETAEMKLRKCSKPNSRRCRIQLCEAKEETKICTNENKRGRIYQLWPHHFLALHRTGSYEVYILFIWEKCELAILQCGFFAMRERWTPSARGQMSGSSL